MGLAALRAFIWSALEGGLYRESFHARFEHREREVTTNDVVHGLRRRDWVLARPPDWDEEHRNWEYLIKSRDADDRELHLKVAVFPMERRFIVVTRW